MLLQILGRPPRSVQACCVFGVLARDRSMASQRVQRMRPGVGVPGVANRQRLNGWLVSVSCSMYSDTRESPVQGGVVFIPDRPVCLTVARLMSRRCVGGQALEFVRDNYEESSYGGSGPASREESDAQEEARGPQNGERRASEGP